MSPAVRRIVATVVAALALLLFVIAARSDIVPMLFGFLMVVGWFFALLALINHGFSPRIRGTMLEATTVLGRQSVDLAALVSISYEIGGRQDWLRFRDQVNDIAIRQPYARRPTIRRHQPDSPHRRLSRPGLPGHRLFAIVTA